MVEHDWRERPGFAPPAVATTKGDRLQTRDALHGRVPVWRLEAAGLVERFDTEPEARRLAWLLLGSSGARWSHTVGVASAAQRAAGAVDKDDAGLLVTAAWLHDVGYAPSLVDTGLHQLDGARYLSAAGAPLRLCRLVANHTCAWVEAEGRGFADQLAQEFPPENSPLADALTFADMTTGPDGARLTVEQRVEEILDRYEPGHVVHESIARAAPELLAAVGRVRGRLEVHRPGNAIVPAARGEEAGV